MVCPHCGGQLISAGPFGMYCPNVACNGGQGSANPGIAAGPGSKPTTPGPWTCAYCRAVNPGSEHRCGNPNCKHSDEIQNVGDLKKQTRDAQEHTKYCTSCMKELSKYLDAYFGIDPTAAQYCNDCRYRKKLK